MGGVGGPFNPWMASPNNPNMPVPSPNDLSGVTDNPFKSVFPASRPPQRNPNLPPLSPGPPSNLSNGRSPSIARNNLSNLNQPANTLMPMQQPFNMPAQLESTAHPFAK